MIFLRLFLADAVRDSTFFGRQRVKHKRDISFLFALLLTNSIVSISIQLSTSWTLALLAGRSNTCPLLAMNIGNSTWVRFLCPKKTNKEFLLIFLMFFRHSQKNKKPKGSPKKRTNPLIQPSIFRCKNVALFQGGVIVKKSHPFRWLPRTTPKNYHPKKDLCFAPRFWWLVSNAVRGTLESRSGGSFDILHSFNIEMINTSLAKYPPRKLHKQKKTPYPEAHHFPLIDLRMLKNNYNTPKSRYTGSATSANASSFHAYDKNPNL